MKKLFNISILILTTFLLSCAAKTIRQSLLVCFNNGKTCVLPNNVVAVSENTTLGSCDDDLSKLCIYIGTAIYLKSGETVLVPDSVLEVKDRLGIK